MTVSNPLAARFAGEPTLVSEHAAERFQSCLTQAIAHPHFAEAMATRADTTDDFWSAPEGSWRASLRPYVVRDGVLQIPVKGVLLHDFPYALGDWATGYDYILRAFQRGCGDFATGAVKGIAFICDTPGGMVAGCFDAVDKMVALKNNLKVPVRAFAHESAYSAGYAIASVADHIVVSRTGGVGSIGVVTSHVDASGAYEKMGLKITFIVSDPSKVEGNSTGAPSAEYLSRTQVRIDELYSIFVAAVARSRGLSEATIRDTLKAYCFTATQAVSNGLADSIGSLDDATSAFAGFLDDLSDNNGEDAMADEATKPSAVDQAALDTARADGHAAGLKEGATAEQTRIGAILGSENAKGRDQLAKHFAFKTTMSVEDAVAALGEAPVAVAPAPEKPGASTPTGTPFDNAMSKDNPGVGSGDGKPQDDAAKADDASDIVALAEGFGLAGFRKPAK